MVHDTKGETTNRVGHGAVPSEMKLDRTEDVVTSPLTVQCAQNLSLSKRVAPLEAVLLVDGAPLIRRQLDDLSVVWMATGQKKSGAMRERQARCARAKRPRRRGGDRRRRRQARHVWPKGAGAGPHKGRVWTVLRRCQRLASTSARLPWPLASRPRRAAARCRGARGRRGTASAPPRRAA